MSDSRTLSARARFAFMAGASFLVGACLLPPLAAQGSYKTFGSGCPGSVSGGQAPGIVLPSAFTNSFGTTQNIFGVGQAGQRYQQVFRGSEIGTNRVFFGYALRENDSVISATGPGGQVTYDVSLGYTTFDEATITTTFASNFNTSRGAPTRVFQGTLNLPQMPGGNTNPANFAFEVKFQAPWVFAFVQGENLLLQNDLTHSSSVRQYPDACQSTGATTTRIYGGSSAATGSASRNYGLVVKFMTGVGGNLVPQLTATGTPSLGQSLGIDLTQALPNTAAALLLGASSSNWIGVPLPFDMTPLGATGCQLLVSIDVLTGLPVDASGNAKAQIPIPNDAQLKGVIFHNQWLVLDASANALGFVTSNGGTATIG